MDDYTIQDFTPGMRVELHPATDAWMMGDRYGDVVLVGRKLVHVKMDRSGKTRKVHPRNIGQIIMDCKPMKDAELGKYVCVAHGGCIYSPYITITFDGVWVRSNGLYSSAHRACYDRWANTERNMLCSYL